MDYGTAKFIKWSELINIEKNYVKNDMAVFNMKIQSANPNDENASKLQCDPKEYCSGCNKIYFRLTINNVDNLMAVRKSRFILQKFGWDLTVFKSFTNCLCLRLCPKNRITQTTHTVKIDFKMTSSIAGVQNIEKTQNGTLLRPHQCLSMDSIISWDELLKAENGFVVNDSVSFEVEINMNKVEDGTPNAKKRRTANVAAEAEENAVALVCAICLDEMNNQDLSSTSCSHSLCTCNTNTVRPNKRCPKCNAERIMEMLRRQSMSSPTANTLNSTTVMTSDT
ncbi:uncharacterized protein LOC129566021 [Sitodiplosis mosellana]|uniref:uncharacterized protein LOC129566021 n=1 Tax=Sitodiplosis mosellana TaxID=263140 RepID=UPI002444BB12|nr:uncharacterized protein LOC129566021 [Sitodiplosis mosellana]